jgi:hypothetical protein
VRARLARVGCAPLTLSDVGGGTRRGALRHPVCGRRALGCACAARARSVAPQLAARPGRVAARASPRRSAPRRERADMPVGESGARPRYTHAQSRSGAPPSALARRSRRSASRRRRGRPPAHTTRRRLERCNHGRLESTTAWLLTVRFPARYTIVAPTALVPVRVGCEGAAHCPCAALGPGGGGWELGPWTEYHRTLSSTSCGTRSVWVKS